jgi:hypothetical protein
MSAIDDKKSIIKQIGVLNSASKKVELPDLNVTLPSLNNDKEPIPFMLDTISVMAGSQGLEKMTGNILTKFVRNVEPSLKKSVKKQTVTHNSNKPLTTGFISGYAFPVKSIDLHGKLKTNPTSGVGSLIYGNNVNNFDKSIYNTINNAGTDITHGTGAGAVIMNYDKTTDKLKIRPVTGSQTIGAFIVAFIAGLVLINEVEFVSGVIDAIFGSASSKQNKTLQEIKEEEKIKKTINKITNGENSFELTENDLLEIENIANNRLGGKPKVDVGCSIIDSNVSLDDLKNLLVNTTGSTDPQKVGQSYGALIDNSFGKDVTQTNPSNKNAIRDGFFKRLIATILAILITSLTTSPQMRILIGIVNGLKNNDNLSGALGNPLDDIKKEHNLIKCLADSVGSLINEFVFNTLKSELIKLTIPITTLILGEKMKSFTNILNSLT